MSLTYKIPLKDESREDKINFCIKCFKGHFVVQYHNKKGWGLKCDSCHFAIRMCEGAAVVKKMHKEDDMCKECGSYSVNVIYKENSPFPEGQRQHQGCLLCDTWLRSSIKCFMTKAKYLTAAEEEEKNKLKEERKRQRDEKK